jgi:RNA polymerase sigma-70 factor (ECF subfamily)
MLHLPPRTARFDELYAEYRARIFAYCRTRSRTAADSEDALAEVFLVAWRRLDEIPQGPAARAWLYATARRVTANQLRSARRSASLLERLSAWHEDKESYHLVEVSDAHELIHAALRRLKPIDREVLLLAEWEQLTSAEIATVMGCSSSSARGRLHRARRRFREAYECSSERHMRNVMAPTINLSDSLALAAETFGDIHALKGARHDGQ